MMGLKRCFVLVGVLLLFGLFTTNVKAEYLGELCWNLADSHGTIGMAKLGITHMGGDHFFVQGRVVGGENIYFSGSGLLVGNTIVFSMSGTRTLPEMSLKSGDSWEVIIDLTTLNGSCWAVSTEYFDDGTSTVHYGEATCVFTSCK